MYVTVFEGQVAVEYSGAADPPRSLGELRESDAFVLGETLSYEVFPY